MNRELTKAGRIAAARQALADRYAADPAGVERFNLRMSRLARAAKRERERVEHLVLGRKRPTVKTKVRNRKGRKKTVERPLPLEPENEPAVQLREDHIGQATPETKRKFEVSSHHRLSLTKMCERGEITPDQKAWGEAIGTVAEGIQSDVEARISRYQMPVDNDGGGKDFALEALARVRNHIAYTRWRQQLPAPRRIVIDMLIAPQMGYHAAARRHRIGWRKARRLLIEALDRWPACVDYARRQVDQQDLDRGTAIDDAA